MTSALPCGSNRAFIDLGANDGQSLSWFEQSLLHRAPTPYTAVYAFEMNPYFEAPLRAILGRLPGGSYEHAAAWVSEGSMEANMQARSCARSTRRREHPRGGVHAVFRAHVCPRCAKSRGRPARPQLPGSRTAVKGGVLYNMTASALQVGGVPLNRSPNGGGGRRGRRRAAGARAAKHEGVVSVRTVDLAAWLASRFCAADQVFLKVDIEGAEFEVFEHLLARGAAALVDTASIEWHTAKRGAGGGKLRQRQKRIEGGLQNVGVRLTVWGDARLTVEK